MKSLISEYLQKNGLQKLEEELSIEVRQHPSMPNLYCLTYSQIDTPKGDPVACQCRGTIVDANDNWRPVAMPFTRFFNDGEGTAAKIDWKTARVFEKLDGSLTTLFYYNNQWNVSTKGSPSAGGNVGDFNFTFAELFWKVWKELNYSLPTDTSKCYYFELCTLYNKVVVVHRENRLVLLGARDMNTLEECFPESIAENNGWECIKSFPFNNISDIIKAANSIETGQGEGFVVCDAEFNRVKIKSPAYVALSHMRDSIGNYSSRRMLEIIRNNEGDEFLKYFEEFRSLYNDMKAKYDILIGEVCEFYELIKNIENQKEFALIAKEKRYSGALFSLRSGKYKSAKEYFASITITNLEDILGVKHEIKNSGE